MAEYTTEQLKKLQAVELEILKDMMKICDENQLCYFMTSGCAIGIERHQGFIPWDDDIDLGIMREDLDKLIEIIKRDYSDKYDILRFEENQDYPFEHANIIKKGTKCHPEMLKELKCQFGIDVAFYPFDHVADDEKERKKQARMVFFYSKLQLLREIKRPYLSMSPLKKKFVLIACFFAHYGMKCIGLSRKWIHKQYMKWATMYNNQECNNVCCFSSTYPLEMMISKEDLFPLVEKKFEDIMVKVPKNNDKYLTQMYGNYMQLPPKEKRKNHAPDFIDFGD